ncbi:DegV family protein [Lacticaseibacillus daqingensis]|uniref:DegV family protein n=1 Tax=Lacticaseibacillus daqingensis TaxID=2486014 RepID=UPI000F7A6B9D|nr:DegV family protein [Lacticaseibacillus daqingensis]
MYQLLTDSACDLPLATLKEKDVGIVSFHFEVEGQQLTDDMGASYDIEQFYAQIKQGVMPNTAQINIGEYVNFFKPYVEAGTPIVYVGFSGGLSGSLSSATQAKAILLEDHPAAVIEVIDTLAASAGEGRLVLEAIRLRDAGTPLAELVAWLNANKLRLQQWFTVDSLDYLYHGGRVSRTAATLGTLLNIKPLLDVDPAGKLRMVGKVRARKKALSALAEKLLEALTSDPTQPLLIATSGDWPAAETVRDLVLAKAPDANIQIGPIGLTIASHTGFGCVAAFVMGAAERQ